MGHTTVLGPSYDSPHHTLASLTDAIQALVSNESVKIVDLSGNGLSVDTCLVLGEVRAQRPLPPAPPALPAPPFCALPFQQLEGLTKEPLSPPPGAAGQPSVWATQQPPPTCTPPPPLQVMCANRSLENLVLRDNPLGHTAARRLMRALQRRPGGGALKQVWG